MRDHVVFHRQRTRRSIIPAVEEAEQEVVMAAAAAAVDVPIIITHIRMNGIAIREVTR